MKPRRLALLALMLLAVGHARAKCIFRPLVVHEWGVQRFDAAGRPCEPKDLPPFLHTPQDLQGKPVTLYQPPVKDIPLAPRLQPVLHFSLPEGVDQVSVAVSLGFSWGEPFVWFPQADRSALGTRPVPPMEEARRLLARAAAGDPEALRDLKATDRRIRAVLEELLQKETDPARKAAWEVLSAALHLPQLEWEHLKILRNPPKDASVPGSDLPESHWVRRARAAGSDWVSNGVEAERFLFYEGKTSESPAVEARPLPSEPKGPERFLVRNLSARPVHQVMLVWIRGGFRGTAALESLLPGQEAVLEVAPAEIPQKAWEERTLGYWRSRLNLVSQDRYEAPPSGLFPGETEALLGIWGADFFGEDGVRLLYREDRATLDEAMPLRLQAEQDYVPMLSRTGLVLLTGLETLPFTERTGAAGK